MKKKLILAGIFLAISFTLLSPGCTQEKPAGNATALCALSLCDCKCYPAGETPEKLKGKICGINCLGEHGLTGCEYKDSTCVETYLTEEDAKIMAEGYIINAPTYSFDGSDLAYEKTIGLRCKFCWQFVYVFTSRHAGYGDRTGQVLAEVITDHRIYATIESGQVTGATIDGIWDELAQKNIGTEDCSGNSDCAKEESKCADGIDPYHVCQDDKCTQLTFVADPCMMDHVCPKGMWNRLSKTACFVYERCNASGCDDNSDSTLDKCVDVGTKNEGCMYTIVPDSCRTDADCVPTECCHPSACENKRFKEPCNVMCTMVCEGPIDCGAGSCACVGGRCAVKPGGNTTTIQ